MSDQISLRNNAYATSIAIDYWNPSDLMRLHQPLAGIKTLLTTTGDGLSFYEAADRCGSWIQTFSDDAAAEVPIGNNSFETSRLVYYRHGSNVRIAEQLSDGLRGIVYVAADRILCHYVMHLHRSTSNELKTKLLSQPLSEMGEPYKTFMSCSLCQSSINASNSVTNHLRPNGTHLSYWRFIALLERPTEVPLREA